MALYFFDGIMEEYQPERRQNDAKYQGAERRKNNPTRITTDQYMFLRDTLFRREDLQSNVAKRGRYIRHVLIIVAMTFVAVFFAAPDFKITLNWLGINQEFTLLQFSAIAPLLIAYLILHASHLAATRLRLIHECKAIELELERFGAKTSYSLLRDYRKKCMAKKGLFQDLVSTSSYKAVYSMYDVFLAISVVFVFVGSVYEGLKAYTSIYNQHPHAAIGFMIYLFLSIITSLVAPVAMRYARARKDKFMDEYVIDRLPYRISH